MGATARLGAAAALFTAAAVMGGARAEAPSPYEFHYATRAPTPLTAAIEPGGKAVATIPAGESGLVLRWCRPEIPFAEWLGGALATWRRLLAERRCEIGWKGRVGFVDGAALEPTP